MELGALAAELFAGLDPDLEMLGDRALVEAVGLAGKLELAVERLVRDAEQGPVWDAETIALRGECRALHVHADGAAEGEAQRRTREAQLPVAVIGGDDRAGAQAALEFLAGLARHHFGGAGERLLHFGNGG